MDFKALVTAQLEPNNAESELKNLCKDREIKLKVKIDDNEIKNFANKISKETETIANNVSTKLKKINSSIDTKSYDAKIKSLDSKITKYDSSTTEYKDVKNSLKEVEKAYNDLKLAKQAYDAEASDTNTKKLIEVNDKLTLSVKKAENEMSILSSTQDKALSSSSIASARKSFVSYFENNTKAAKAYKEEIIELQNQLDNMSTVADKAKFDTDFKNLQSKAILEGNTGKSLLDESKRAFSQIAKFTNMYGVAQTLFQEVPRQMVQAVYEVDTAMIELRKVSDATDSQLSSYFNEATESAKKYGATVSDVISSTADWSRLGYELDEAKVLSNVTTLIQRVGDNMTQESASSGLISALQGFQLETSQAQHIADAYNEVANNFAIGTDGIADAVARSASSMSAAGNSMEQTIGLITAANTVVQDPDSVGTSFKTLSMRIRGAKTELEEAGLETDGMAESTAELQKEIKALTGIDIMLDENTFKSTYDILDELSQKWQDLTDIQQASVTELIAGKRQGNIMSALMSNFDIAREATATALGASEVDGIGSANKELENYQKGLEYSIDRLKAAFQELSTTTIDSGFLKGAVDIGTTFLEILNKIIDNFGILQTLIGSFAIGKGITTFVKGFDKPALAS